MQLVYKMTNSPCYFSRVILLGSFPSRLFYTLDMQNCQSAQSALGRAHEISQSLEEQAGHVSEMIVAYL